MKISPVLHTFMIRIFYHENFCLIFDIHSAVVNQGFETTFGEGKNHDRGVMHDHEKQGGKPLKNNGF